MRHSEYISKARSLIHDYETRTFTITTTEDRIALLGRQTRWTLAKRKYVVAEIEDRIFIVRDKTQRTKL